jgi:hypothetical protein
MDSGVVQTPESNMRGDFPANDDQGVHGPTRLLK